jgi:hypothetical protein
VEVPAAKAVRLIAGLHLDGVGELRHGGDEEERRRMRALCGEDANNGAGIGFYKRGERRACTRGAHLRQPVFRRDGLTAPLRKAVVGVVIRRERQGNGRVETTKRRWCR